MPAKRVLTLRTVTVPTIGTFGTLYSNTMKEVCKTVERDWVSNKKSVSCIPEGLYKLTKYSSAKYPKAFALTNEALGVTSMGPSQRTHILIHPANYASQLEGCIAPGLAFMPSTWGVSSSRIAFKTLSALINEYIEESRNNTYLDIKRSHQ